MSGQQNDNIQQQEFSEDEYEYVEEDEYDLMDQDPTKLFEYDILEQIGQGSFAKVFLIRNRETNTLYAAKSYSMQKLMQRRLGEEPRDARFFAEVSILSSLNHKNCLKIIEVIKDDVTKQIYLIIPYAAKGPLVQNYWEITPMPESEAKNVFRQLAEAIQYLHQKNIIHRDIKPDNILVHEDGTIMLCDFSISKQLSSSTEYLDDTQGTTPFKSPEEMQSKPFDGKKADVWSYGISLYTMIFGHLPYNIDTDNQSLCQQIALVSKQILETKINLEKDPPISNDLRQLFNAIFVHNPDERPTIDQILEMNWFKN